MISLSFLGSATEINLQAIFIPDFSKINFKSLPIIIIVSTTLVLMILGLLFSSIESSSKVNRLLSFLKNGMPDKDLPKLDRVSRSIAEYIKGIGGTESIQGQDNNDYNSEIQEVESPVETKKEVEELPFEQENKLESDKMEAFEPSLPNPDEFDGEDKKTIVASSFDLAELENMKPKVEEENKDFTPSNFSDFADDDDSSKGAETVIASVPEELLRESQNFIENNRENEFKSVFNKFYEMKIELGEPTNSLTESAFIKKLKDTEKKLITSNKCKKVEFTVYNKNGKAALKATPKY